MQYTGNVSEGNGDRGGGYSGREEEGKERKREMGTDRLSERKNRKAESENQNVLRGKRMQESLAICQLFDKKFKSREGFILRKSVNSSKKGR